MAQNCFPVAAQYLLDEEILRRFKFDLLENTDAYADDFDRNEHIQKTLKDAPPEVRKIWRLAWDQVTSKSISEVLTSIPSEYKKNKNPPPHSDQNIRPSPAPPTAESSRDPPPPVDDQSSVPKKAHKESKTSKKHSRSITTSSAESRSSPPAPSPVSSVEIGTGGGGGGTHVQVLPEIVVILRAKTQPMAEMCSKYPEVIQQVVLVEFLERRFVRKAYADQKEFSLIEPRTIGDAYGLFTYDFLADGDLRLIVCLPNRGVLPERFTIGPATKIQQKIELVGTGGSSTSPVVATAADEEPIDTSLAGFVRHVVRQNNRNDEEATARKWLEALEKSDVVELEDIRAWTDEEWNNATKLSVEARRLLKRDLPPYYERIYAAQKAQTKKPARKASELEQAAIARANAHKAERYLHHRAGRGNRTRPLIDPTALELAFRALNMADDVPTGALMDDLYEFFRQYCSDPSLPMTNHQMGLLLYGPPGTGKSVITAKLMRLCGIQPVAPPLAATDMNRPHVGETEEVLRALFERAHRFPYLLCAIAIDEIDALTPKRNQKTSEHAISALSTVLALVGGIKQVPNIMVMASTNRLNAIDDAMLRRLSSKFFVGRPEAQQRERAFEELRQDAELRHRFGEIVFEPHVKQLFVACTTNFSGAALSMLRSQIIKRLAAARATATIGTGGGGGGGEKTHGGVGAGGRVVITRRLVLEEALLVCDMMQIRVGSYALPAFFNADTYGSGPHASSITDALKGDDTRPIGLALIEMTSKKPPAIQFFVKRLVGHTARVPAASSYSASSGSGGGAGPDGPVVAVRDDVVTVSLPHVPGRSTKDLLPTLAEFAIQEKLAFIQLIDWDVLAANAAFDEQTQMEILTDRVLECRGYRQSLLVIDLDSLVGVSASQSSSSMGPSLTHSFTKPNLFSWAIDTARHATMHNRKEHWVFFIASSQFMYDRFKEATKFPLTEAEHKARLKAEIEATEPVPCPRCRKPYIRAEEDKLTEGKCRFHIAGVKENPTDPREPEVPEPPPISEIGVERYRKYTYLCCGQNFDPSFQNGCRMDMRHLSPLEQWPPKRAPSSHKF